jgi:protein phosphatase
MNPSDDMNTDESPALASQSDALWPQSDTAAVQVELAARSDQGNVRPNNEDHFLVVRFHRALETLLTNLPDGLIPVRTKDVGYGMVVADGMGGMAAGEVASREAIRILINLMLTTPDWIMRRGDRELELVMQRMAERYRRVHAALREEAQANPKLSGMGTTMTLACSLGADLILTHVGDSRAYLVHDGQLHLLTHDHTLVQDLVDQGVVRPEAAATHPFRRILTRDLGGRKGEIEAETRRITLADQDQLLLCTDGLTDMVDTRTIGEILRSAVSANDACQVLVNKALQNGGKDNVTVVLARYRFVTKP